MKLSEYQERAQDTDVTPFTAADERYDLVPLLGLVDEAASIVTEYKKYLVDGDHYRIYNERLVEEIGDVLWYLANFATKVGVDLEYAAERNLAKTKSRFIPEAEKRPRPLDIDYRRRERLPVRFRVALYLEDGGKAVMSLNGRQLGDPLTDNAYIDDGYRFHDVFHWAYVAILGWSPVVRRMLKRKRKSDKRVDEVEDGARAAILEEAVSALAFASAENYSFFAGSSQVESKLLRDVRTLTAHLEVRRCSPQQWERAILTGFAVWREINRAGGGTFCGDYYKQEFYLVPREDK